MKTEILITDLGHEYVRRDYQEWSMERPLVEWLADAGLETGLVKITDKETIYELEQAYQLHENNRSRK